MEKKNEGAGAVVILYSVFLTLGILTMSFAVYDRYRQTKEKKEASKKAADIRQVG